jgi:UDPglucose 6-dehydrogenase
MVGTGYVGLVTGVCFAESGNQVICADVDEQKIAQLSQGQSPIYEPGLSDLLARNLQGGRLSFTTSLADAVAGAQCIFIAVGTPQGADGAADLGNLWAAVDALVPLLEAGQLIIIKSTVPVGTNAAVARRLAQSSDVPVQVASNPEFLKEGAAINDFTKPDRVVVGVREADSAQVLRELYTPFLRTEQPFLVMSPESAEMTKYAANAMLATKISFINEMANLCERTGADIKEVHRGICHDKRIGFAFMFPGVGYGGSCFPKDVRALVSLCRGVGGASRILEAVDHVNECQKELLFTKICEHYPRRLNRLTMAVWGLAFKPGTDDIREAPALVLIDRLLEHGARLRVHDPVAMANVAARYGDRLVYCENPYDALESADGLAILTEWSEFRNPDFAEMRRRLARPVLFDGRNLYDEDQVRSHGFTYYYVGQASRYHVPVATHRAAA